MKRIGALLSVAFVAISMCGCNNNKDSKTDSTKPTESFVEISPEAHVKSYSTQVVSNTFDGFSDFIISSDHTNTFFTTLTCDAPKGLEDGTYSSPDVTATVDGVPVSDDDRLAYVYVSGGKATVTVAYFGGYVKKGSEMSVTVKNFNKLLEPENEEDIITYYDISNETVLEGTLVLNTYAENSFGYYRLDASAVGGNYIELNKNSAAIDGAEEIFKDNSPTSEALVVVLNDGEEVTFDVCQQTVIYDEEGNPTNKYNLTFIFSDTNKEINLDDVTDIKIASSSMMN